MSVRSWSFLLCGAVALASCKRSEEKPFVLLDAPKSQVLQSYWAAPQFSLTERSGRTVTPAELKGKVWVVDFFYSTCPGPCPMLSSRLSDLHQALKSEPDVRFVSISTDPAKDTPEVLQQYAHRFNASEKWLFLTGDKQQIYSVANEGFKLSLTEDPAAAEPITHSTRLALVDRKGMVRGYYEGVGADDTERLKEDIRRLLGESA